MNFYKSIIASSLLFVVGNNTYSSSSTFNDLNEAIRYGKIETVTQLIKMESMIKKLRNQIH